MTVKELTQMENMHILPSHKIFLHSLQQWDLENMLQGDAADNPRGLFMNWTDNIIVRNIRVRTGSHGWDGKLLDIENPDQALGTENTNNIIIDHCSFGWSGEEICTNSNSFFQTYQYCIFHEGLYDAGHKKGSRGIIDDPMDAEMVKAEDGTYYCSTTKPSEKRPDNWDTDGDGMPDEWEREMT